MPVFDFGDPVVTHNGIPLSGVESFAVRWQAAATNLDLAILREVQAQDRLERVIALGASFGPGQYATDPDQCAIDATPDRCWRCDAVNTSTDVGLCAGCLNILRV